jgi:hypothetical protein
MPFPATTPRFDASLKMPARAARHESARINHGLGWTLKDGILPHNCKNNF